MTAAELKKQHPYPYITVAESKDILVLLHPRQDHLTVAILREGQEPELHKVSKGPREEDSEDQGEFHTWNKRDRNAYEKWRKRARRQVPAIAQRVFDLGNQHYNGCGFHYNMVKRLGACIRTVNDYDQYKSWYDRMLDQMFFEELFHDVVKAEKSARES